MNETKNKDWIVSYPDDGNAVCYTLEDKSFWYQHRNQCILKAVQTHNLDRRFYDIGGGNGVTAQVLQDAGYDVTLVEPYEAGIVNARSRGIKKTIQSTLEEFASAQSGIKAVGFFDVMEHIGDDKAFLTRINKMMAMDGKIVFTVPAFQDLWSDNDVQLGHYRRYNLSQLQLLVESCGFEVEYQTYFFSLLWLPMWLLRVVPNRLGYSIKNTPAKKKGEHLSGNETIGNLIRRFLHWELHRISKNKKIVLGTSCLIIAKKSREQ